MPEAPPVTMATRGWGFSASPASVSEGGVGNQSVTYTYVVTNTSSASTDPRIQL